MKISAINDEIADDIFAQLEKIKQSKIKNIELRNYNNQKLLLCKLNELSTASKIIDIFGLKVSMIDTGLGKKELSFKLNIKDLLKYANICKIFKCDKIRIFSNLRDYQLIKINNFFSSKKIKVYIENEENTSFKNINYILDKKKKLKLDNLYILLDIGNYSCENSIKECLKDFIINRKYIDYIHIRDILEKSKKCCLFFEGDLLKKFIRILEQTKYEGIISVESHMPMYSKEKKEDIFMKNMNRLTKNINDNDAFIFDKNDQKNTKYEKIITTTYYNNIMEFVKKISDKFNLKYKLDNNKVTFFNKKIKIDIYYVKNPDCIRTFSHHSANLENYSLSYFIDMRNSYITKIKKYIEQISLEYNDDEINSIVNDMVIAKRYSQKNKKTFQNTALIWRDHFLEENISLLKGFIKMGIKPSSILALDKGDKTLHRREIMSTFIKLGIDVDVLDNKNMNKKNTSNNNSKHVINFIEKQKDKNIIIMDDGAIITNILKKKYENIIFLIELTEMGLRRIKRMKEICYPILNLAKSDLKTKLIYPEIANSIVIRILELLGGEKLRGRVVILCGYGDMGKNIAKTLNTIGSKVVIVEPDIMRLITASEKGYFAYDNIEEAIKRHKPFLVIGASGYQSITNEAIKAVKKNTYITSGATADLQNFENLKDKKNIENIGTVYFIDDKKITVLGNGRSVNLFLSESIPNKANDIFKAACLVIAREAYLRGELKNGVHLEPVNTWIKESGILEEYYKTYMK